MLEYNIIKFCKKCKERFVVSRGESKKYFCDKCQVIVNKEKKRVDKEERMKEKMEGLIN